MADSVEINPNLLLGIIGDSFRQHIIPLEYADKLAEERKDKKLIVVAAMPRSGSTFLANVLTKMSGFPYARLCYAYSSNEHDLYPPALCFMNNIGCVSQLHIKGTPHNVNIMNVFRIKPIILVRNIYDIVPSLLRDLREKQQKPDLETGFHGYSFLWQNMDTKNLSDEQMTDLIIDLVLPWYVNFFVSWQDMCNNKYIKALWVTYEDLMENKSLKMKEIFDFLGVKSSVSGDALDTVLNTEYSTFGSGKSGKGYSFLSKAQRVRVKNLFSYYKTTDLKMLGI